jgi:hypothetical protein
MSNIQNRIYNNVYTFNQMKVSLDTISSTISSLPTSEGPQGFKGISGSQGPQGFPGAGLSTGSVGIQGPTGSNGGPQGYQGSQGPQGNNGIKGSDGLDGPVGETGLKGLQGPTGPSAIGLQGSTGSAGIIGFTGFMGLQGSTGSSLAGAQGPQGITIETVTGLNYISYYYSAIKSSGIVFPTKLSSTNSIADGYFDITGLPGAILMSISSIGTSAGITQFGSDVTSYSSSHVLTIEQNGGYGNYNSYIINDPGASDDTTYYFSITNYF